MKIKIEDIENENVEFEKGIWVFLAKDLSILRKKLQTVLFRIPRTLDSKPYSFSKKKIKEIIKNIKTKKL